MLHIILAILKVIGVLLLVILALLLLLVLILCFMPFRYRLYLRYKGTFQGRADVRLLGPLVLLRVVYDEGIRMKLRICGIPFGGRKKPKKRARKNIDKKLEDAQPQGEPEHWNEEHVEDAGVGKERYGAEYVRSIEESEEISKAGSRSQEMYVKAGKESLWSRFMRFWTDLKEKCRALFGMFRNMKRTICAVLDVYRDEGVKLGLSKGKSEILRLLKKCRPRRIKGYLKIGFEDPANTGKALAALAVLRGMWNYCVEVTPDFEHSIFETEVTAKGYIQGIWLLRLGWKLMFDKDIRYAMKRGRSISGNS